MTDTGMSTEDVLLRRELAGFLEGVEQAAALNPRVDLATGHAIHRRLGAILDDWAGLDADARAKLTKTVTYVVNPADSAHDFFNADGLVDDEAEVSALEAELGREGADHE